MKARMIARTIVAVATVGLVIGLVGCPTDEDGAVSITDRINQLESDLNGDYDNVYLNWHPDSTTRLAGANPTALETAFPSDETYEITSITVVSESGDTGTATAVFNSDTSYVDDVGYFDMQKDGDDWYISELTVGYTNLPKITD